MVTGRPAIPSFSRYLPGPGGLPAMHLRSPRTLNAFDAATAVVLEEQFAQAERTVNVVRLLVLGVLAMVASWWAPHLTPALNVVNIVVWAPMLTWAIGQELLLHARGRRWAPLSMLNTTLDITSVSILLLGYGITGMPDLAVKSPIWSVYFVMLSARSFTGSSRRAVIATLTTLGQYALVVTYFFGTSRLALLATPLDSAVSTGSSIFDESAKLLLLAIGGMVVTYAARWNERTLARSVDAMRGSEARFRAVFEHSAIGVALLDRASTVLEMNEAFARFLGAGPSLLLGRKLSDFAPAEDAGITRTVVRDLAEGRLASGAVEVRFVQPDGHVSWGAVVLSRAEQKDDLRLIAMVQDVSERKTLEAQLLHQAFHDPLTGLANRALFRDRVAHGLTRTARGGDQLAVLFLDLDNFKAVNDTQGHAAGDRLLQVVAERLLNATRGCDTVARLGGDEFAVLVEHVHGGDSGEVVAERIVGALAHPFEGPTGRRTRVSASIGIAVPSGAEGVEELLRNADVAMYEAKAGSRGGWIAYDPDMHAALVARVSMETDLRRAVEREEFHLAYQPIVSLVTGELVGMEALLRWTHPQRGPVPPSAIIPIAEAGGLILPLGGWVLRTACEQAAAWNIRRPERPISVTVNLSGRQLQQETLVDEVSQVLSTTGLAPSCLTLEITETVIMQETAATLRRLEALKALGVRLAIDDFGTGYSSLSYLQQFPVDVLKIDRSFTEGLLRGANEAALVRTIIALAEMLGLRTIAEGVEDPRQGEQLLALGCDLGQGFLFSPPVDAAGIERLLGRDAVAEFRAPMEAGAPDTD